jgi:hypothetical protein
MFKTFEQFFEALYLITVLSTTLNAPVLDIMILDTASSCLPSIQVLLLCLLAMRA